MNRSRVDQIKNWNTESRKLNQSLSGEINLIQLSDMDAEVLCCQLVDVVSHSYNDVKIIYCNDTMIYCYIYTH